MTQPTGDPLADTGSVFTAPSPGELSSILTHYEVRGLIAAGGMGAVYRGLQKGLDRPVAIKLLPVRESADGEEEARFRTEAKAMARLSHAHIPAVYDFGVEREYCFFVMELVEGSNAHQLIHDGAMTPDLALTLLSQVSDALHYAHLNGILHGDIKPANILVSLENTAKLADFGVARLMEQPDDAGEWAPMGTPEYAAPELFLPGVEIGPRADIYALGVVLHEMLTGAPPSGEFELPARALRLDPRVDTVIATCMRQEPAERYADAEAVRAAIDAIRFQPRQPEALAGPVRHFNVTRPGGRPLPRRAARSAAASAPRPSAVVRPPSAPPRRRKKKRSTGGVLPTLVVIAALAAAGIYYLKTKQAKPDAPPAPRQEAVAPAGKTP